MSRFGPTEEALTALGDQVIAQAGGAATAFKVEFGELRELTQHLDDLGVHRHSWKIDLSLARGIDYYTGPVCEARVETPKVGSIAGTGRSAGVWLLQAGAWAIEVRGLVPHSCFRDPVGSEALTLLRVEGFGPSVAYRISTLEALATADAQLESELRPEVFERA